MGTRLATTCRCRLVRTEPPTEKFANRYALAQGEGLELVPVNGEIGVVYEGVSRDASAVSGVSSEEVGEAVCDVGEFVEWAWERLWVSMYWWVDGVSDVASTGCCALDYPGGRYAGLAVPSVGVRLIDVEDEGDVGVGRLEFDAREEITCDVRRPAAAGVLVLVEDERVLVDVGDFLVVELGRNEDGTGLGGNCVVGIWLVFFWHGGKRALPATGHAGASMGSRGLFTLTACSL